jgi:hypothetical protein
LSGICGSVSRHSSRLVPSISSQSSRALSLSLLLFSLPPILLSWLVIRRYIHCVHPHLLSLGTQVFFLYYLGKHVHKMRKVNKVARPLYSCTVNEWFDASLQHTLFCILSFPLCYWLLPYFTPSPSPSLSLPTVSRC